MSSQAHSSVAFDPDEERQNALSEAYERNVSAGRSPYAGVEIHSREELEWILRTRNWVQSGDRKGDRIDHANLSGAMLRGIDLTGIDLREANLSGCDLISAVLKDARLTRANLRGARLTSARLQGTKLQSANLTGASLTQADGRGADLRQARMDADTRLNDLRLDRTTKLGDVAWNSVPLMQIDWSVVPVLGDEEMLRDAPEGKAGAKVYREVARAYHGLAVALRLQGLSEPASHFRLCEQQMERSALRAEGRHGPWLFSYLLFRVSGYGEQPGRALQAYIAVVLGFAVLFFGVTNLFESAAQHLNPLESLILSISSFHGRGFLPSKVYTLDDPVAYVAALEAITGLFIEVVVIATFSRRFLGD